MDISTRRKILESNMAVLQKKAAALKKKDAVLFARQKMLHVRFLQVMSTDIPTDSKQTTTKITDSKVKDQSFERRSSCPETTCIDAVNQVKMCSKVARRRSLSPTMVSDKSDPKWEIRKNCSTGALDRLICVTGTLQRPKPSLTYTQRRKNAQTSVEKSVSVSKQGNITVSGANTRQALHHYSGTNRSDGSGCIELQDTLSSRRSSGYESDFIPNNVCRNEDYFVQNSGHRNYDTFVEPTALNSYRERDDLVLNNVRHEGKDEPKLNKVQRSVKRVCVPNNVYRYEDSRIYSSVGDLKYLKSVPAGFTKLLSSNSQCTWC